MPRPHVSGYFFSFRIRASVQKYHVNPTYESATFLNPLSSVEIFEFAIIPESCGR